ncbi:hypothetical protein L1987_69257 [Smallanthus sonchifolius]|uniref:Uncharacterized protein n=1 Tax=Smallanthus sonchifolius TaxID=185202 RepID=A0ACB9B562_9ASTR|nr:hypothetical protein L1987_69257 [Smallanthus sonchifolius]
MYLTVSRPDIMFVIFQCASYQANPKLSHLNVVKRIIKYLKGKPRLSLWYLKDSELTCLLLLTVIMEVAIWIENQQPEDAVSGGETCLILLRTQSNTLKLSTWTLECIIFVTVLKENSCILSRSQGGEIVGPHDSSQIDLVTRRLDNTECGILRVNSLQDSQNTLDSVPSAALSSSKEFVNSNL